VLGLSAGIIQLYLSRPFCKGRFMQRVVDIVKSAKVDFVEIWFCDILGFLKSQVVTPPELERAAEDGIGIDGSSLRGVMPIKASDMVARLDPATFALIPWRKDYKVGRVMADLYHPNGEPFSGDPRTILKNVLAKVKEAGFNVYIGPEIEYFYFRSSERAELVERCGYFDILPDDAATKMHCRTIEYLAAMGIEVEKAHHEAAPSQHELDLRYDEALRMADKILTTRYVIKTVARQEGLHATFMPKPIATVNGSGMHTHISLFTGSRNAFFDKDDEYHFSKVGKQFIAGLLKHSRQITLLTNQWVNSYKRLTPGFEAPVYVCWAQGNRSVLARVPIYKKGKETATRIEYRSPDPACNPYLAIAAIVAAGFEGIKNKYELGAPFEGDVYTIALSEEEMKKHEISTLPGSLVEAIVEAENSKLVREILGEHAFRELIRMKRKEWLDFSRCITQYELDTYLPIL